MKAENWVVSYVESSFRKGIVEAGCVKERESSITYLTKEQKSIKYERKLKKKQNYTAVHKTVEYDL